MRIEWTNYTMMRGMEIVLHSRRHESWCNIFTDELRIGKQKPEVKFMRCTCLAKNSYSLRINSMWDLLYFFIDIRYMKFWEELGWWKYLYVPVRSPEYQGTYFYLFPIGAWIYFGRWFRRLWFYPFILLHQAGYTNLSEGALPALFWPVHLCPRRHHRSSGNGVS